MPLNYFYIPENINLDEVFRNNPISHIDGFKRDKLLYVLHLLAEIPSTNKDLTGEDGYIPINAEILKEWIGKGYTQYLNYLQDAGIIECDNQFIIGIKSRGYRFCKKYQQTLVPIPVTDRVLAKKLDEWKSGRPSIEIDIHASSNMVDEMNTNQPHSSTSSSASISNIYAPVHKWYNKGGLKINHGLAHAFNEGEFAKKRADRSMWDKTFTSHGIKWKNPYIQYIGNFMNIEKIRTSQCNPHPDSNVYRYHSALTQCKKEIRNAIKYDSEELVAVDLSNSQPTLLTLLLDDAFWSNIPQGGKLISSDIPYLLSSPLFSNPNHFPYFITLCKNAQSNRIKEKDEIGEYYRMVEGGNFYSAFRMLLKERLGLEYKSNDEVKPMLFTVLFTDNRFIGQIEAEPKRIFKAAFPSIYEITSSIKKNDAANLPLLLQRIESYIMYHRIIPRITREKEYLPIFTLHDSIATIKGNEDYVENVMREEFAKCLGFTPHFKRDYWQESKLRNL